MSPAAFTIN